MSDTQSISGDTSAAAPAGTSILHTLLASHLDAVSRHDVGAVLATMTPSATLMGTAPTAVWTGHESLAVVYQEMFGEFDRGTRSFEHFFFDGHIIGDMAWAATMSKGTLKRQGDLAEFGTNLSLAFERVDGRWLIQLFHFSTSHIPRPDQQ